MNIISGLGGAAKSFTIKFMSDTAKGTRDANAYFANIRRQTAAINSLGRGGMFGRVPALTGIYGGGGGGGRTIITSGGTFGGSIQNTGKVANQTRDAFNKVSRAGGKLNNTLGRTVLAATRTNTAFGAMGGILRSIPGWARGAIVALFGLREAFKHGIMVESSKLIMETLTGSEKAAVRFISKAREYSIRTLFKPEEVLGATTTAIQRGIDPYKKGAYGLAKDKNAMDIFAGLGSMMNPLTGKVLGVNRMAEAILRGDYRLLRPVRGIINPAYEAAQKTGYKVGTPGFNEKFIEELGKIPAIMELAKKQSESIQGLWSTISGLWQEFWMDFSGAGEEKGVLTFWSQVKGVLLEVRDSALAAYVKLKPFIMEVGTLFGTIFKFFYTLYKGLFTGSKGFGNLLIQVLRIMVQLASLLLNTIIKIMEFGMRMAEKLFGAFFSKAIARAVEKLSEFVTGLQMFIQWWGTFLDLVAEKVDKFVDRMIIKFKAAAKEVTNFMRNFPIVGKVWDKIFNFLGYPENPEKGEIIPESPPINKSVPSSKDILNKSSSIMNSTSPNDIQYMMLNALYDINKNVKKTNDQLVNGGKTVVDKSRSTPIGSNLSGAEAY